MTLPGRSLLHDDAPVHKDDSSATSRAKAISWVTMIMVVFCSARERMTLSTSPVSSGSRAEVAHQSKECPGGGPGPGDGHPLLLAAGELTGVVVRAVTQTHLGQQLPALG